MNKNLNLNIRTDDFGRTHGLVQLWKPYGVMNQDFIDIFRKIFRTHKIGHTGSLDPMAQGIIQLLIGKDTTKTESLLLRNKVYQFSIIFNLTSATLDIEKVKIPNKLIKITPEQVINAINQFPKEYKQNRPIYSAVKVSGKKLHKLVRKADTFNIFRNDNSNSDELILQTVRNSKTTEYKIPQKLVKIANIEILDFSTKPLSELISQYFEECPLNTNLDYILNDDGKSLLKSEIDKMTKKRIQYLNHVLQDAMKIFDQKLPVLSLVMEVTSGFYVRQFAQDLATLIDKELHAIASNITRLRIEENQN